MEILYILYIPLTKKLNRKRCKAQLPTGFIFKQSPTYDKFDGAVLSIIPFKYHAQQ